MYVRKLLHRTLCCKSAVHKITGFIQLLFVFEKCRPTTKKLRTIAVTKINRDDVTNRMLSLATCFVADKMIKCILSPLCMQPLSVAAFVGLNLNRRVRGGEAANHSLRQVWLIATLNK